MASRRIGSYVADWVKLGHKIPPSLRSEFGAFRTKHQNIKSSLDAIQPKPPTLDWSLYKSKIAKPGMVEAFQKAAMAVTVPYPKDSASAEIDAKAKEMALQSAKAVEISNAKISEINVKVDELRNLPPFEEMTVEYYMQKHPELEAEVEEQVRRHQWDPDVDYSTLNRLERQGKQA